MVLNAEMAPKLTGMFLLLGDPEIIELIDNPAALQSKIQEALDLLRSTSAGQ